MSDASLGALTGSAFAIVYALLGLYFGALADAANRLKLARFGAWIWSLGSMGAALVSGYAQLVASRAMVATGEAIATAAIISLIAQIAGERHRARASSVLFACAFVGAGLAAMVGGYLISYFRDYPGVVGWRVALAMAGVPGIAGALYLSRFRWQEARESTPARKAGGTAFSTLLITACVLTVFAQIRLPANQGVPVATLIAIGAGAAWVYRLRRIDRASFDASIGQASFRWLLVAFAAVIFIDSAASFWLLPIAQRHYGVSAGVTGASLGGLMIVGGIAGSLLGGVVADHWRQRSPAGRVWTALVAALLEAAAIVLAILQPDYSGFVAWFCVFCLASGVWTGVAAAIGLDIVAPRHHGIGVAAYFLVTTLFGAGLGTWATGELSEVLGSLTLSLSVCCLVILVALAAFLRLASLIRRAQALPFGSGDRS